MYRWRSLSPALFPSRRTPAAKTASGTSLSDQVRGAAIVLRADKLDQLRVGQQTLREFIRPRLREGLRVVNRDLDFECSVVDPAEALGDFAVRRQRRAFLVNPSHIAKAGGLDD